MLSPEDQAIIDQAINILETKLPKREVQITKSSQARTLFRLKLQPLKDECFCALWLDNDNRVIKLEQISSGTLRHTHVPVRNVVRSALDANAASAIFVHNHPSGRASISKEDRDLTTKLIDALKLIQVNVLDHMIVANDRIISFVEEGEL